ncbi:APC family permease [Streptomyces sp. NRRL S-813]|uniref:APC family permease n=1 Tax=Streptomyces sp. NRRL S-813 TaxID=1463919 RepID=UPI0004BF816C|nr:APC family permease [Streptomyces sp. NRRL S-813]
MADTSEPMLGSFEAGEKRLGRHIGLWGLISLAVSVQIGSGWLFATIAAASKAGPASVVAWCLGAAFFAVVAVPWMELGTMLPRAGSAVRYPRLTHGSMTSWFNGWGYYIAAVALPVIEVQAVLSYTGGRWPSLGLTRSEHGTVVLAWPNGILSGFALLIVFFFLNIAGVKVLAESNKYMTIWKLVIPVTTFVLMMTAFKSSNFSAFGGFAPEGVSAVFGAVSGGGIVFAYNGIRQILDFGSEVKNPQRNIPIAMIVGGLVIPLLIYVSLQIGFIGAIDWNSAGVLPGRWSALIDSKWGASPLLEAVTAAGFASFSFILLTDAVISPAATGWVWLGIGARTGYSMSVNGEFPKGLQRINRGGVPWTALALATGLGFIVFLPVPSWYKLVSMDSTALVIPYLLAGPTMAVLRREVPDVPRPVFIKAAAFWAPAAYVASLAMIYFAGWNTLINLMTAVFLALPLYAGYTSPAKGWSSTAPSRVLAVVFVLAWVLIGWNGGWLLRLTDDQAPDSWSFGVYYTAMTLAVAAFMVALRWFSNEQGRRQIRSTVWLVVTFGTTLLVSYFGQYGPHSDPPLGHQIDIALIIVLGVVSYYWSVASGYQTQEARDINDNARALAASAEKLDPAR